MSTNAQARNHQKELPTRKKCLRTKNAGNRQKEQVTRELGCAIEHHLLKCFLSWTQIAHLGSDLHSCSTTQAIASKGKLLFTLKMPTNEHQGKPPEKASYPCHGCALLRINYLLIKKCLRMHRKETARKGKLPLMWPRYCTLLAAVATGRRSELPVTWLRYFTSLAEVLPELDTNRPPWLGPALLL